MEDVSEVSGVDAPGSGWGGSVSGKPGEDAMTQSGAQQDRYGEGMGNVTGFDTGAPTQTVDQLQRNAKLDSFLSSFAPIAMSAMVPHAGILMGLQKGLGGLATGKSLAEVLAGPASGILNSLANRATGGITGAVQTASNLSGYMGGPTVPNLGREIVGGIIGGGRSTADTSQAQQTQDRQTGDRPEGAAQIAANTANAPGARAPTDVNADVDYSTLGTLDTAGWTNALKKYREATT